MRYILSLLLLFWVSVLSAQSYVYVNTDYLILRSKPEGRYQVKAVLYGGARLKVERMDDEYINDNNVKNKFYYISASCTDKNKVKSVNGWVVRKYVVSSFSAVKNPERYNFSKSFDEKEYMYNPSDMDDASWYNDKHFPAPKYKGGETITTTVAARPPAMQRIYHLGPKGGCYYFTNTGQKRYVNSKYCR